VHSGVADTRAALRYLLNDIARSNTTPNIERRKSGLAVDGLMMTMVSELLAPN
jgi:hypothetical protein